MPKVEVIVIIERPVSEVFAFVANMENLPQWDQQYLQVRNTSPDHDLGVGATYSYQRQGAKEPIVSTLEITDFARDQRLAWQTAPGRVQSRCSYTFESVPEGTRLTAVLETRLSGLLKLLDPMFVREMRTGGATIFTQLKELLESDSP